MRPFLPLTRDSRGLDPLGSRAAVSFHEICADPNAAQRQSVIPTCPRPRLLTPERSDIAAKQLSCRSQPHADRLTAGLPGLAAYCSLDGIEFTNSARAIA